MNGKENFTLDSHFDGKAEVVRKIYAGVIKALEPLGAVVVEPKKTSIHLVNATALAGVATRKDYLILTIKSDRRLDSPRIHKSEQASSRRFYHEIKLTSPADVDNELIGWLEDAYMLSSAAAKKKRTAESAK